MKLKFTARHFKAPDRLKIYIEKKVKKLDKFYDGIMEAEVVCDWQKVNQLVEIRVKVYGTTLIIKEKSPDMFQSVDMAVDKLENQMKKYKTKLHKHSHEKVVEEIEGPVEGFETPEEEL